MKPINRFASAACLSLVMIAWPAAQSSALVAVQADQPSSNTGKSITMSKATGAFEVKITPASKRQAEGLPTGLMMIEKTLTGDISGTGLGEMLTGMGEVQGSAAYVAVERITGTLHGHEGSFMLAHKGVMSAAGQSQDISVVPDSGTGALTGISGTFFIILEDGKHSYEFEYSLPSSE